MRGLHGIWNEWLSSHICDEERLPVGARTFLKQFIAGSAA